MAYASFDWGPRPALNSWEQKQNKGHNLCLCTSLYSFSSGEVKQQRSAITSHVCHKTEAMYAKTITQTCMRQRGREMLPSLTSFASVCCCSFFFFFLSFFLSLHWPAFPPAAPAFPCRFFPEESRPPLVIVFPASEASESESESIWSRAKREAVVGTVIIADDAIEKTEAIKNNTVRRTWSRSQNNELASSRNLYLNKNITISRLTALFKAAD